MSAPPVPPRVCETCESFYRDRRSKWPGRCNLSGLGATDSMRGCYFYSINPLIAFEWLKARERERTEGEPAT